MASLSAERRRKHHRRILVVDRVRIVQDGTHAELLAADGLYVRMFKAQAAWNVREEVGDG